ncbi:MAG: class I poly(R)-hydroxyalkanoic acid synthase [Rhodocyclaceae bacterium]|nr:class I poly(R)-hydroxyalkanoic acid synthase [Rhodocyclaceae bacterium]
MNFQTPFWPGAQGIQDLPKQIEQLTQSFGRFLQEQMPGDGMATGPAAAPVARLPQLQKMQPLVTELMSAHKALWEQMLQQRAGEPAEPVVAEVKRDRRFSSAAWTSSPVYDYLRQAYVLNSRFINGLAAVLPAENAKEAARLKFLTSQFIDALSPSNFAATNPEVIQKALATEGQSITEGINNLIRDMAKGRISTTDESAFEVGRNLATTEGAVVYENDLIQLIQYKPLTARVGKRPLLITPPCINRFYIMDLQPESSLVRFAIESGHTVFLISWKNPGQSEAKRTWDEYIDLGPLSAIPVVQSITGSKTMNMLGFCVGGTLLSTALAVLAARGEEPAASLTLLTTMLDFANTGDIDLFIDEPSVAAREAAIGQGGILEGRELAGMFSSLRPNDLVWPYVSGNYLLGNTPPAFDILYWNADSTGLPGPMACWYLRNTYLENRLRIPGELTLCGESVDLGRISAPTYLLATREDHIVPWQTAYLVTRLLSGPHRFVLGASGHIAGVINPASKNRRNYWVDGDLKGDAEQWLASATEKPGSWWHDWAAWLEKQKGGEKAAPKVLGNEANPEIEPAPGRYVKAR